MERLYNESFDRSDFGIQGYRVATTCQYIEKSFKFPISQRFKPRTSAKSKTKSPDPTLYNEPYEVSFKRNWKKPNGKFLKGKRLTIIDDIRKKASKTPGPGDYSPTSSNKKGKEHKVGTTFGISDKIVFLANVEFSARETPSSWDYSPRIDSKKRGKPWIKPKRILTQKSSLGPGKYADGVEKAYRLMMASPISHSFSNSRPTTPVVIKNKGTKENSASYTTLDKAYSKLSNFKRDRTTCIFPYKNKGFADDMIKKAKLTPGPGAYNIGPPIKKKLL